jgi:amino-acid N-acetyltransferase
MNTELVTTQPSSATRRAITRRPRRVHAKRWSGSVTLRTATSADASAIHRLIEENLVEGHLLPRTLDELEVHAPRFVVAVMRKRGRGVCESVVACAELAPLSGSVAEVRSLVVDSAARSRGIGRRLIDELRRSARRAGFDQLCAFTHHAAYFVGKGFSIVPHTWVPEKIARDCVSCPLFRACGQHAVVLPLTN